MKYILKKKWHPSQVEEVGHVFEEDEKYSIEYKFPNPNNYLNYIGTIYAHEIALLVHAGYLKEEKDLRVTDLGIVDLSNMFQSDPTLDLWTTEPPKNTDYWFVGDDGYVHETYWIGVKADKFRLKTNNCHKTQKSAEEALKRLLD